MNSNPNSKPDTQRSIQSKAQRSMLTLLICLTLSVGLILSCFVTRAIEPQKRDLQWAYMMNFIPYFSWPDNPNMDEVDVCIIGRNPFAVVRKYGPIKNKNVRVMVKHHNNLPDISILQHCQVIYFSSSITTAQLSFIFTKLKGFPIVTMGDHQGFIKIGGILQFTQSGNKLRFRLNKPLLNTIDIKIHPSLLRLSD
jgi:hypothetical protein